MKSILLSTAEFSSVRFERLCERLKASTEKDCYLVGGHLAKWFFKWGADPELDAGLFWNTTETALGRWSSWEAPLAFGRALVEAGYCRPLSSVYPALLLGDRSGFCHPGALDASWDGVHKHRANAAELVLYLTDQTRRARQAKGFRITSTAIPAGWLEEAPARSVPAPDLSASPPRGSSDQGAARRLQSGVTPDLLRSDHEDATPPAPHVQNVPERFRMNQRNVPNVGSKRTGNAKTPALLSYIRAHKYDNPLDCLLALDGTEHARTAWFAAIDGHLSDIQSLLAEMTETDDAWAKIGNPAALAFARVKKMLRLARCNA